MANGVDDAALRAAADAIRASTAHGRVIAMLNIKGGVGKTVLGANLFAVAHLLSQTRVCFIDLDPQANLSQYFLSPVERHALRQINQTVYSVFAPRGPSSLPLEAFARLPTPLNRKLGPGHFDLVAGDERLFEYTLDLRSLPEKDQSFVRFHALIAELRPRYDVLVIDTNPCATFLTRCAVTAVDHIVAPVKPERYSLTGLNMLEQIARHIRERPVLSKEFTTVLNGTGDRFRPRAGGDPDLLAREEIEQAPFFGATLAPSGVPFSSLLRAAPSHRYTTNPINQVALLRGAQKALRESLVEVAQTILMRAGAL
jgi:chromosome partitioning protein